MLKLKKIQTRVENRIFNEETVSFMQRIEFKADCILTSLPYNTCGGLTSEHARETRQSRYDIHLDNMTPQQYIKWTLDLFHHFNDHLKENGVVLYNLSYSSDRTGNTANKTQCGKWLQVFVNTLILQLLIRLFGRVVLYPITFRQIP